MQHYPEFYNLAATRYSCRKYTDEPVDRDLIIAVLDAARLAPSACNRQPWKFLVIDTPELLSEVRGCYDREWFKEAPVCIVAVGMHDEAWHRQSDGKDHTDVDVAIAVEHLCLAATSLDLATCWICNFDCDKLKKILDIPAGAEPVAMISLGYPVPGQPVPAKNRKTFEEIVKWGKF